MNTYYIHISVSKYMHTLWVFSMNEGFDDANTISFNFSTNLNYGRIQTIQHCST